MRLWVFLFLICFCLAASAVAQNVVLFTVDSCRADRFGVYGHAGGNTPHIDAWAKTGTVFEQAYSVSAWTAPGLVSILTGLYPPSHGVNSRDRSGPEDLPTLVKLLKSRGYRAPNLNFFTFAPYYSHLGLDQVERKYFGREQGEELINWLKANAGGESKQPFFVWYHTTIVHQPYNPAPEDLPAPRAELEKSPGIKAVLNGAIVPVGSTRFTQQDRVVLDQLYNAEIRRMDRLFQSALEALTERGVLKDTLVVLTADHGEELLDHGFVGHASTSLQAKLYQEVVRIPLIFSWPGHVPEGKRVKTRASQIDVAPTVLARLGAASKIEFQGRDLFGDDQSERPLYFESAVAGNQTIKEHEDIWIRAVLDGDYKFISSEELYDVKRDPGETRNLVERHPEVADRLRRSLNDWLAAVRRPQPAAAPPAFGEQDQQCPVLFSPGNNETLRYDTHTGAILIDWSGDMDTRYLVQYEIGEGDHYISGTFEMEGNHQLLGPLGPELWDNLKAWNPFRIRVSPRSVNPCWSPWVSFRF